MQGKIDDAVAAIRAADEYTIFADKYKTNPPEPVIFKFDDSLFEGYPSENLPESLSTRALSLNDQTVDHMKHRGKELESQLNVRAHHIFSRILNSEFSICKLVFSREKKIVFSIKITIYLDLDS
jgi:hypothetical protein